MAIETKALMIGALFMVVSTFRRCLLSIFYCMLIWAATWQNQQNECVPSEDSDQPGHPPSLIRVFACAQWVAKYSSFLHADSEDTDQTRRMPRLIWVFARRTLILLVFDMSRLSYLIFFNSETPCGLFYPYIWASSRENLSLGFSTR